MTLSHEQIIEVQKFQISLSHEDEWLFYHLAWVAGDTEQITYEDTYEIMQRWDEFKEKPRPNPKPKEN